MAIPPDSRGSLRWLLDAIARLPPPEADEALGVGALVGRYRLLERLGRGGFGVVYRAVDSELGREVALKLLHGPSTPSLQPTLLREAKAMARLKHANIVTVFDVGSVDDGQLFIAMELVDGTSLRRWLDEHQRSAAEILRVFLDAAAGLAAAHAAGLVHCDFKPDNVLVGRDGIARVADFGVASSPPATMGDDGDARPHGGTPRYMSLEQVAGDAPDARMDQFSFAVALWEALAGSHPFGDGTVVEQRAHMKADTLAPASVLPGWLRQTLAQALAADPGQRFPSMTALSAALRRDPARRRRRILVAVAVALVCLGVSGGTFRVVRARSLICKGAERKLAGVWDPPRREAARAAFMATGKPAAATAFEATAKLLDDYAGAFVAEHTRACEATQLRGEQSAAVEDLRMLCLEQRRRELAALTSLLSHADAALVERAPDPVLRLSDIAACADVRSLQMPLAMPSDPALRKRIADVKGELAATKVLVDAQRAEGLAEASTVVAQARAIGWSPLVAEALLRLGKARETASDPPGAEAALEEALWLAESASDDVGVANAGVMLTDLVGNDLRRFDDGARWGRLALAVAARVGDERLVRDGELHLSRVDSRRGHSGDARRRLMRALEITERLQPLDTERLAMVLDDLGGVDENEGRYDDALARYQRALTLTIERKRDPGHPAVANHVFNMAAVYADRGDYRRAISEFERARDIYSARLGPEHIKVAETINQIGTQYYHLGKLDEALALEKQSMEIVKRTYGADHPYVVTGLSGIAGILFEQGKLAEARPLFVEALALATKRSPGGDTAETLPPLTGLAWVETRLHHFDAAMALQRRALAVVDVTPHTRDLADMLVDSANMALEADRVRPALAYAERGLAVQKELNHGEEIASAIPALHAIGEAHLAAGDAAQAVAPLERAAHLAKSAAVSDKQSAEIAALLARARRQAHQ